MLEIGAALKTVTAFLAGIAGLAFGATIVVGTWLATAWLVSAAIVGWAGRARGRSLAGWLLLAVGLTPPLAALMLLVLPDRSADRLRERARRREGGLRLCPRCAEAIRAEARACRFCGAGSGLQGPPGEALVAEQLVADQRDQDQ